MQIENKKLLSEKKTVEIMITMYCESHHKENTEGLCLDCNKLLKYSLLRIDNCVYGVNKPACEICTIHCYNDISQKEIKKVMRYAGPRMILRHPLLSLVHFFRKVVYKRKNVM